MESVEIITLTTLIAALGALLYQNKKKSEAFMHRSEEARARDRRQSDEALQKTEAALQRSYEALQKTEAALQRSEAALQRSEAARALERRRSDEALQKTEAALQRSDEALQQTEAALQRSEATRAREGAEKDEKIRQALFDITADDLQTQSSEFIVEYQRLCQLYAVYAVPAVAGPSQDVEQDTRHYTTLEVDATR